ncbi:MAG: hypothetical protein V1899_02885 [Planctomycetota bacterium]
MNKRRIVHLEIGKRKLACGRKLSRRTLSALYPLDKPLQLLNGGTLETCRQCLTRAKDK